MIGLAVPTLLARVRVAYEGKIILLKGPEVALRYTDPARRGFIDLDLFVEDVALAQRQLIASGCEEVDDPPWALQNRERDGDPFSNKHHGRPLRWPDLPLKIELHRWPNWPRWFSPPASRELFSAAVPSALDVEGILTLPPEHHALVLAAHSWVHEPLGRIRDVLDVAVMVKEAEARHVDELAERWGMGRLWRATRATADALFGEPERRTLAQRTWARNIALVRGRTVFEAHLSDWTSCFWSVPPSTRRGSRPRTSSGTCARQPASRGARKPLVRRGLSEQHSRPSRLTIVSSDTTQDASAPPSAGESRRGPKARTMAAGDGLPLDDCGKATIVRPSYLRLSRTCVLALGRGEKR